MKKLLVIASMAIGIFANAQTIKSEDGLYKEDGQLYSGPLVVTNSDGSKKSEATVKDGALDGKATYFYENGEVMEQGNYIAGAKAGLWIRYNTAGIKISEGSYNNGKKNGTWIVYDDNGNKVFQMAYKDGEKTGTWEQLDGHGVVIKTMSYGNLN